MGEFNLRVTLKKPSSFCWLRKERLDANLSIGSKKKVKIRKVKEEKIRKGGGAGEYITCYLQRCSQEFFKGNRTIYRFGCSVGVYRFSGTYNGIYSGHTF